MAASERAKIAAGIATWIIAGPTLPFTWLFSHVVISTEHLESECRDLGRRVSLFLTGLGFWVWSSWYIWNIYRLTHVSPYAHPLVFPDDLVVAILDALLLASWITVSRRFIGYCFQTDTNTSDEEVNVSTAVSETVYAITGIAILVLLVLIFLGY